MKFYDEMKPLYIKTDVSGVDYRTGQLQIRKGMNYSTGEISDNTASNE